MRKSWIKGESKIKSKSWNKPESSRFQTKTNKQKIFSRFKLILEYEGTRYSGWQKQQNARTVQGELIKACEQIFGDGFLDLQGSGRTDSGVHALSQVAHLDADTMLASHILMMKLNDLLPYDINILALEKSNKNFHARHSAKSRIYLYQISRRRNAFEKNHVWWVKDKMDYDAMKKASKLFIGMNDFSSFSDDDPEEKSTKVVIDDIALSEKAELILIRITGSHFIWKMVRRIVGILVEVGRGKMSDKDILFYLNNKSNEPAKFTAPPSGLFLEKVIY
jgi:tRNA pseudouridine38-40 synthase